MCRLLNPVPRPLFDLALHRASQVLESCAPQPSIIVYAVPQAADAEFLPPRAGAC